MGAAFCLEGVRATRSADARLGPWLIQYRHDFNGVGRCERKVRMIGKYRSRLRMAWGLEEGVGDQLVGGVCPIHSVAMDQHDLFPEVPTVAPPGLKYEPQLIAPIDAASLVELMAPLPFKEFEFHGFTGKRRVVSFGWKYNFSSQRLAKIGNIPGFLIPLRDSAARFAGLDSDALEQVLVTEYQPGASIGWHRDKAVFDEVVGVSLGASCTMRFRQSIGGKWERRNVTLEPGSAYLISGEARTDWEHSIPPVARLRYSVTFRSMRR